MGYPRITYNSVNIDLVMGKTGLKITPIQDRNVNESGSGKIETINLFGRFEYEFDCYFSQAVYHTLWAWWAWARQGKTWTFALDSAKTGNTTLDDTAASGQKVIPVTATTGFAADDYCLLRAVDNDDEFEIIKIASVSSGVSVTAESNLIYSYNSDDTLRHKGYFPSVVLSNNVKKFDPKYTGVSDTTKKYYKDTIKFTELL